MWPSLLGLVVAGIMFFIASKTKGKYRAINFVLASLVTIINLGAIVGIYFS